VSTKSFKFLPVMVVLCAGVAVAQQARPEPYPSVKPSAAGINYVIRPGDVITVDLKGDPRDERKEGLGRIRVDGRGMISLPTIGAVSVACQTPDALTRTISASYLPLGHVVSVQITVEQRRYDFIEMSGAFSGPAWLQSERPVGLAEAIAVAGGLSDVAAGRVNIWHVDESTPCLGTLLRDPESDTPPGRVTYSVPGSAESNLYLRRGDVVEAVEKDTVYVVGEIVQPSMVFTDGPISLSQAIARAGGLTSSADRRRVQVNRWVGSQRQEFNYDLTAINKHKSNDPLLKPYDLVGVNCKKKIICRYPDGTLGGLVIRQPRPLFPIRVIY
jgi:protein involved in polysaccharide export with SLBB domain